MTRDLSSRPSAVLLDRDGVINLKPPEGSYVSSWREFVFLPGTLAALAELKQAGLPTVVVTNQRGVARGVVAEAVLEDLHRRMCDEVEASGGRIDAVYYCPHEGGCDCRKPRTGLLERAGRDLEFKLSDAVLIGDRLSDMQAAKAVGARAILVPSDADEPAARLLANRTVADLTGAVRCLLRELSSSSGTIAQHLRDPSRSGR